MTLIADLFPVAWRLSLVALIGAVIPGLAFRSWLAAGIGYTATFAVLAGTFAALLFAVKREHEREVAAAESGESS